MVAAGARDILIPAGMQKVFISRPSPKQERLLTFWRNFTGSHKRTSSHVSGVIGAALHHSGSVAAQFPVNYNPWCTGSFRRHNGKRESTHSCIATSETHTGVLG
jgi:hypothetical protein